ncbi:hypothetical protein [Spirosoma aerolatum]|uniref:hypothetical protein n=1 Tax=Spirosoma aerolatum TaxID=1211326 RepID=UPI0012D34BF5|nr:hypothetical protein [Spirosoma aerolatum]
MSVLVNRDSLWIDGCQPQQGQRRQNNFGGQSIRQAPAKNQFTIFYGYFGTLTKYREFSLWPELTSLRLLRAFWPFPVCNSRFFFFQWIWNGIWQLYQKNVGTAALAEFTPIRQHNGK